SAARAAASRRCITDGAETGGTVRRFRSIRCGVPLRRSAGGLSPPLAELTHPLGVADQRHDVGGDGEPMGELAGSFRPVNPATRPFPVVSDEDQGSLSHCGARLNEGLHPATTADEVLKMLDITTIGGSVPRRPLLSLAPSKPGHQASPL